MAEKRFRALVEKVNHLLSVQPSADDSMIAEACGCLPEFVRRQRRALKVKVSDAPRKGVEAQPVKKEKPRQRVKPPPSVEPPPPAKKEKALMLILFETGSRCGPHRKHKVYSSQNGGKEKAYVIKNDVAFPIDPEELPNLQYLSDGVPQLEYSISEALLAKEGIYFQRGKGVRPIAPQIKSILEAAAVVL